MHDIREKREKNSTILTKNLVLPRIAALFKVQCGQIRRPESEAKN